MFILDPWLDYECASVCCATGEQILVWSATVVGLTFLNNKKEWKKAKFETKEKYDAGKCRSSLFKG